MSDGSIDNSFINYLTLLHIHIITRLPTKHLNSATNLYPDNLLSRTVQAFSGKKGEYSQLFTFGTKKHLPNLTG